MRDIHVAGASYKGRNTVIPRQLFEAADRLSCDNTFIGAYLRDFNSNPKKSGGASSGTDSILQPAGPWMGVTA